MQLNQTGPSLLGTIQNYYGGTNNVPPAAPQNNPGLDRFRTAMTRFASANNNAAAHSPEEPSTLGQPLARAGGGGGAAGLPQINLNPYPNGHSWARLLGAGPNSRGSF